MSGKATSSNKDQVRSEAKLREDRLKAALKSNMARRKAQARARADGTETDKNE